jgi:hypothetical protein
LVQLVTRLTSVLCCLGCENGAYLLVCVAIAPLRCMRSCLSLQGHGLVEMDRSGARQPMDKSRPVELSFSLSVHQLVKLEEEEMARWLHDSKPSRTGTYE